MLNTKKNTSDFLKEIEELRNQLAEVNETNAQLVQFVHAISHDLKAPLRKIVAYSGRLKDVKCDVLKPAELNHLNVISKSASRLSTLVEDLTRYSLNTAKPDLKEIDLTHLIGEVIDDLEVIMDESNAEITLGALPAINASEFQMKQLFLNLLNNAIKFRKKGVDPFITVSAELVDKIDTKHPYKKYHKISVHDNGIGIEKQYLQKIFAIFQQLHAPGEYEGNGIGLAICKRIMDNHHGKIEAESLENGTVFNLYFPEEDEN